MTLPNLIIVGAPKCATTSLHFYLSQHPQIWMSRQKELHFFNGEVPWSGWKFGLNWYSEQFQGGAALPIRGESSPGYSIEGYTEEVVEKMAALLPDIKLIYMLRDPVARVRSHYLEEVYNGHISPELPLDQILSNGPETDLDYRLNVYTSLYFRQLSFYLKRYKLEQIHFCTMEGLLKDSSGSLAQMYRFLGVDEIETNVSNTKLNVNSQKRLRFVNPTRLVRNLPGYEKISTFVPLRSKRAYRWLISRAIDQKAISRISPENEDKLRARFAPDVAQLRSLTGHAFSEWSV